MFMLRGWVNLMNASMNDLQKQAVEAPTGYLQIIAGPGTGKTVTIVGRIVELLNRGVESKNIVVLSFTRAAAREIKHRVSQKLGREADVCIGTFHSIAYRFLRRFGGDEFSKLTVIDDTEKKQILQSISDGDAAQVKELLREITQIQVFGKAPRDSHVREVYNEYVRITRSCHRVDYDGLLVLFRDFLKRSPVASEFVQAVLVDEFQDTSYLQLEIAVLLSSRCESLTVVGDPDQSIYAFRNAEPRNFELMLSLVPKQQTYIRYLEQNYRSQQPILDTASRVIAQSSNSRYESKRKLVSAIDFVGKSGNRNVADTVRFVKCRSQEDEASQVVKHISFLIEGGVKPSEICVLARESRSYRFLETQFLNHRINVRMVGGAKTLMQPAVRAIVDYMRVALDNNDQLAISRTINYPPRKIGPAKLRTVCATGSKFPEISIIRAQPPGSGFASFIEAVDRTAKELGTTKGLDETKSAIAYLGDALFPDCDIAGLMEVAENFAALIEEEADAEDDRSFTEQFTSLWSLQSTSGSSGNDADTDSVTLSTIHSAKGLEWPVVFLVGASQNPSSYSVEADNSEEMRLLYVALTRAKCYLVVTSPTPSFDPKLAIGEKVATTYKIPDKFNAGSLSRCVGREISMPALELKTVERTETAELEAAQPTHLGKPIDLAEGFMLASDLPLDSGQETGSEMPQFTKKRKHDPTSKTRSEVRKQASNARQSPRSRPQGKTHPQASLLTYFQRRTT